MVMPQNVAAPTVQFERGVDAFFWETESDQEKFSYSAVFTTPHRDSCIGNPNCSDLTVEKTRFLGILGGNAIGGLSDRDLGPFSSRTTSQLTFGASVCTMSNQLSSQPAPPMMGMPDFPTESKFDFWGILNRRKWIVFLGLLSGLLLGTLYQYKTPSRYQSVAKFSIQPKDQAFLRYSQYGVNQALPSAAEILPTRHDKYLVQPELIKHACETYQLYTKSSFASMSRDDTVKTIIKNLEALPEKEDPFLFTVYFRAASAADATSVLNNITETYRQTLEKKYAHETTSTIDKYKEQQIVYQQRLKDAENAILALANDDLIVPRDTNGADLHSVNVKALGPKISDARERLATATTLRDRLIQAIQEGPESMEKEVWKLVQGRELTVEKENPRDQLDRARIYENLENSVMSVEGELDLIRDRYGPGHPKYEAIEKRLVRLKKSLDERKAFAEQEIPASGIVQFPPQQILEWRIEDFNNDIERLQLLLQDLLMEQQFELANVEKIATLRQARIKLEQEENLIRKNLNEIQTQIHQLSPTGKLDAEKFAQSGFIFEIQQEPSQGELVWPILPIVLAIGGLVGALLGFGLGCLVDLADKTFHNPDEIIRALGMPLIGHIPVISQAKRYQLENSSIEPAVCTYHRPKSQVSEAYRAVRTALFFSARGSKSTVIQVTSPTPGDGKSTTAANLAVSIAQSGKKVLLLDADMRRPRVGQIFGVNAKEGFATVLSGESFWKDVVYECSEIEGLSILPCGMKPSNPAELASSPQVKLLIDQLRSEFDFVIIDTPPLLAVTDPCPIATRVDGVVVCMRIKKNVRISAERAIEVLRNLGANIVGVVVNGVGAQTGYGSQYTYGAYRAGYSYNGYGYGYGYGYGNYYDEKNSKATQQPAMRRIENAQAAAADDQPVEL